MKLEGSDEPKYVDVDHPIEEPAEPEAARSQTPVEPEPVDTDALSTIRKAPDIVLNEYPSPAFMKRGRLSYGALFEGGFDIFEEDGGVKGRGRKRTRFGRDSTSWRYSSQSPSPEPTSPVDAMEEDTAEEMQPDSSPKPSPKPQMTDEACQTVESEKPEAAMGAVETHDFAAAQEERSSTPIQEQTQEQSTTPTGTPPGERVGNKLLQPVREQIDNAQPAASSPFGAPKPVSSGFSMFGTPSPTATDNRFNMADQVRFGFSHTPLYPPTPVVRHEAPLRAEPESYPAAFLDPSPAKFADMATYVDAAEEERENLSDQHNDMVPQPPITENFDRNHWEMETQPPLYNPVEGGHFGADALNEGTRVTEEQPALHSDQVAPNKVPEGFSSYGTADANAVPVVEDEEERPTESFHEDHRPREGADFVENEETYSDDDLGVENDDAEYDEDGDPTQGDYDQTNYDQPEDDDDGLSEEESEREEEVMDAYGDDNVFPGDGYLDADGEEFGEEYDSEDDYSSDGDDDAGSQYPPPGYRPQPAAPSEPVVIDLISDSEDEDEQPPAPTPALRKPAPALGPAQRPSPPPVTETAYSVSKPANGYESSEPAEAPPRVSMPEPNFDVAHNYVSNGGEGHLQNNAPTAPEQIPDAGRELKRTNHLSHRSEFQSQPKPSQEFAEQPMSNHLVSQVEDQDSQGSSDDEEVPVPQFERHDSEMDEDMRDESEESSGEDSDEDSVKDDESLIDDELEEDLDEDHDEVDVIDVEEEEVESREEVSPDQQLTNEDQEVDERNVEPMLTRGEDVEMVDVTLSDTKINLQDQHTHEVPDAGTADSDQQVNSHIVSDSRFKPLGYQHRNSGDVLHQNGDSATQREGSLPVTTFKHPTDLPLPLPPPSDSNSHRPSSPPLTESFKSQVPESEHKPLSMQSNEEQQPPLLTPMQSQELIVEETVTETVTIEERIEVEEVEGPPEANAAEEMPVDENMEEASEVMQDDAQDMEATTEEAQEANVSTDAVEEAPTSPVLGDDNASGSQPVERSEPDVDAEEQISLEKGREATPETSEVEKTPKKQATPRRKLRSSTPQQRTPQKQTLEVLVPQASPDEIARGGQEELITVQTPSPKSQRSKSASQTQDTTTTTDVAQNSTQPASPDINIGLGRQSLTATSRRSGRKQQHLDPLRTSPRVTRGRSSSQMSATPDEAGGEEADQSVTLARSSLASPSRRQQEQEQSIAEEEEEGVEEVEDDVATTTTAETSHLAENITTTPAPTRAAKKPKTAAVLKTELTKRFKTELKECIPLNKQSLQKHVDKILPSVVGIVASPPSEPVRLKQLREYVMTFHLTDPAIAPSTVIECQLYRPHKDSLPLLKLGDAVRLQNMQVKSLAHKGFGLRSSEGSAWAVWDHEDVVVEYRGDGASPTSGNNEVNGDDQHRKDEKRDSSPFPPQIKGPPVEDWEQYADYMTTLKVWYKTLIADADKKDKLEKAIKKMGEATAAAGSGEGQSQSQSSQH